MVANFEVTNPNFFGFQVHSGVVTAFYPEYKPPLGLGSVYNVDIPHNSTVVVPVPIYIGYDHHQDSGLSVIKSILRSCFGGATKGQIKMNFDAHAVFKVLKIFGFTLDKSDSLDLRCPINIEEILRNVGDKIKEILRDIADDVGDAIDDIVDKVRDWYSDIDDWIDDIRDDIGDIIGDIGDDIGDIIDDLLP
ncbi:hypothetical protein BGZ76_011721 [Entomortierella beljakovae]|nr:hypothetical protein BGZ76_011721 [Entomortierella beljakovae]